MRRGEIWVADLNPPRGREMAKIRPVVILQAEWLTRLENATIVVLPLTAQFRPKLEPLRTLIRARGGLRRDCQTVPDKIRTLDRARFGKGPLTTLTPEETAAVERSLKAVLGML